MSDEVRTYDEVARWLPRDIVDHIEVSLGCRYGTEHDWDKNEFVRFGDVKPVVTFWSCRACHTTVSCDPEEFA